MKRAVCLLILLAILPSAAAAQRRMRPSNFQHTGAIMVGVQKLDLGDFNNALSARYSAVDESVLAIGIQGMHIRQRFILGAEGMALVSPRDLTSDAQYYTRLTGGYGMLNLGYAAVHADNWLVYPLVGIGGGAVQYNITPAGTTTFGNVVLDPGRSSRLTQASLVMGVRAGVQYNLRMGRDRSADTSTGRGMGMGMRGLSLGVRAGYNFAALHSTWREMDADAIAGGPDVDVSGPQVVFTIGGWR